MFSGVFVLNIVCREESLWQQITHRISSVFSLVSFVDIPNDVNKVLFATKPVRLPDLQSNDSTDIISTTKSPIDKSDEISTMNSSALFSGQTFKTDSEILQSKSSEIVSNNGDASTTSDLSSNGDSQKDNIDKSEPNEKNAELESGSKLSKTGSKDRKENDVSNKSKVKQKENSKEKEENSTLKVFDSKEFLQKVKNNVTDVYKSLKKQSPNTEVDLDDVMKDLEVLNIR